jgi:plasmid maintenance system antidote protein VapI
VIDLESLIREEIDRQGLTQYRIAKDLGIAQTGVLKFLAGGGLRVDTAVRLLDYLGMELRVTRRKNKGRRRQ